jgi:hypothetical protein
MVVTEEDTHTLLEEVGVTVRTNIDVGSYHYGIVAIK